MVWIVFSAPQNIGERADSDKIFSRQGRQGAKSHVEYCTTKSTNATKFEEFISRIPLRELRVLCGEVFLFGGCGRDIPTCCGIAAGLVRLNHFPSFLCMILARFWYADQPCESDCSRMGQTRPTRCHTAATEPSGRARFAPVLANRPKLARFPRRG